MKKSFWLEKWQSRQVGFHKGVINQLLVNYIDQLQLKSGDTVFVPLCGKTLDMLWLHEQGYRVIGVEYSEIAVEQFFIENQLSYEKHSKGLFNVYTYKNITIFQGDFFDLTKQHCENINAVYDRAALIALPEGLVESYVNKLLQILPDSWLGLLVTLEYTDSSEGSNGPPFSTSHDKVNGLFGDLLSIHLLNESDIIDDEPRFKAKGCDCLFERLYLISE